MFGFVRRTFVVSNALSGFWSPPKLLLPGGWTPHMKGVGMLVVSLRGVNIGFWSHIGCSGQTAITFSREGLV